MRKRFSAALLLCLFIHLLIHQAYAETTPPIHQPEPCNTPDSRRFALTEIPTPLEKPKVIVPLGCDRPFLYQNEIYSTDPPQTQDASTLKYFVREVPEANKTLEDYQRNRKRSHISAYTGSVGLLLMIFSYPLANFINSNSQESKDSTAGLLRLSGLALASGGFLYSIAIIRVNESLLPKAVNQYNQARPNDPIELKFTTGWSF